MLSTFSVKQPNRRAVPTFELPHATESGNVNVEPESDWSLQPGSERDALGGALRRTICVEGGGVPGDILELVAKLEQPEKKGEQRAKRVDRYRNR